MTEIGVRELKARASQIIRSVRDRRARYLITHRGRPVGLLMPLDEAQARQFAASLSRLPHLVWVPLDSALAKQAVDLAAQH